MPHNQVHLERRTLGNALSLGYCIGLMNYEYLKINHSIGTTDHGINQNGYTFMGPPAAWLAAHQCRVTTLSIHPKRKDSTCQCPTMTPELI